MTDECPSGPHLLQTLIKLRAQIANYLPQR